MMGLDRMKSRTFESGPTSSENASESGAPKSLPRPSFPKYLGPRARLEGGDSELWYPFSTKNGQPVEVTEFPNRLVDMTSYIILNDPWVIPFLTSTSIVQKSTRPDAPCSAAKKWGSAPPNARRVSAPRGSPPSPSRIVRRRWESLGARHAQRPGELWELWDGYCR